MQNFTIYYKDHLGRNNQADSSGKTEFDAIDKFKTLYPDCTVIDVVEKK